MGGLWAEGVRTPPGPQVTGPGALLLSPSLCSRRAEAGRGLREEPPCRVEGMRLLKSDWFPSVISCELVSEWCSKPQFITHNSR